MLVLHANWSRRTLWLWAESSDLAVATGALPQSFLRVQSHRDDAQLDDDGIDDSLSTAIAPTDAPATPNPSGSNSSGADAGDTPGSAAAISVALPSVATPHPFAASSDRVAAALHSLGLDADRSAPHGSLQLWLPGDGHRPNASHRLAAMLDLDQPEDDPLPTPLLVPAVGIPAEKALALLLGIEDLLDREAQQALAMASEDDGPDSEDSADSAGAGAGPPAARGDAGEPEVHFGHGLRFWIAVARFAVELLEDQRLVPTLVQRRGGPLRAAWHPWLRDAGTATKLAALVSSMPGIARAVEDDHRHDSTQILEEMLGTTVDAVVRQTLRLEAYEDAIDGRDPLADPHVAWLAGLLDGTDAVPFPPGGEVPLLRGARAWLAALDDTGEGLPFRLLLRLNEPDLAMPDGAGGAGAAAAGSVDDDNERNLSVEARWWLSLHLVSPDEPREVIDAGALWSRDAIGRGAPAGERGSELLLGELGRASRIYPKLEKALAESTPTGLFLTTGEAYAFLREHRGVLLEAGFQVEIPEWWDQPQSRLAARLVIESDDTAPEGAGANPAGLQALVRYRWQIALGERPIAIDHVRQLASRGVPLVRVGGRWVEIREEDLAGAVRFLEEHPGGEMTLLEALRLAHGAIDGEAAIPITGMEAGGWVAKVIGPEADTARIELLAQPTGFLGSLRPYQQAGLSWLAFLDRFGLGACLADDMGLGKTIQLIALLQHERETARANSTGPEGPTLLVAPMSVLANWHRELNRFAPELRVHVHHGLERPLGDAFVQKASESDIVVTTYALVVRDHPAIERIFWRRVCLDEAQHIKNPPTKQTAAIRSIQTRHRVALTGTPVENRLSELWSIMEFCNPGYLGTTSDFRRRFAVPVERHRDRVQADRLRQLVRPFILRRVKTDPNVIADLPPLVETKHVVPLTVEQAALYERVVAEMLARVDRAEGIQRRGLVLAALVKLKQICNHPGHFLKETASGKDLAATEAATPELVSAARSGKAQRLIDMLEEVVAAGDRALLFTQYREMGHMLVSMIRRHLDVEALFLHGGTPAQRRQQLIDRFQSGEPTAPIFVLSLKAGGVGLNLTAANHVFHYDRWWNPAVENQATDRAFRIGQLRTVHVHKLICAGTLEERIDQMIEQKTELAAQIVGAGETWLTELSTGQLRDLFLLRRASLADEDDVAVAEPRRSTAGRGREPLREEGR